jgi:zinc transporter 2
MRKLRLVTFVSFFFIAAQLVGGYLANSIAIFTDTAHLASDVIGFAISMKALKMTLNPASKELTFGWHRAEIIGTMVSVIFLLTLTMWLLFEAVNRIVKPQEVKGKEMMITAVMGLFFNLIQMQILHQGEGHYHLGGGHHDHDHDHEGHDHHHEGGEPATDTEATTPVEPKKKCAHGHDHSHDHKHDHKHDHAHDHAAAPRKTNINVDAAFLHALGDMIMSVGVVIASCFICYNPAWTIADPICTIFFSIIVCVTVTPVVKNCINVLMEGSPSDVDTVALLKDIKACAEEGETIAVHDFHLWSISIGKYALSAHIATANPNKVLKKVTDICKGKPYLIDHVTLQMEDSSLDNEH